MKSDHPSVVTVTYDIDDGKLQCWSRYTGAKLFTGNVSKLIKDRIVEAILIAETETLKTARKQLEEN